MHECPFCGQACDCDGEDTWLEAPYDCNCPCNGDDDDDEWDDDYEDDYDYEYVPPTPIQQFIRHWRYRLAKFLNPVVICPECGKPYRILYWFVGDHRYCLPF